MVVGIGESMVGLEAQLDVKVEEATAESVVGEKDETKVLNELEIQKGTTPFVWTYYIVY